MLASSQQDASFLFGSSALKTSNSPWLIANIFRQHLMAERCKRSPGYPLIQDLWLGSLSLLLFLLCHCYYSSATDRLPSRLSSSNETWKWILLFQTQLMIYLQPLLCPGLKLATTLLPASVWSEDSIRISTLWLVNKYRRVPQEWRLPEDNYNIGIRNQILFEIQHNKLSSTVTPVEECCSLVS